MSGLLNPAGGQDLILSQQTKSHVPQVRPGIYIYNFFLRERIPSSAELSRLWLEFHSGHRLELAWSPIQDPLVLVASAELSFNS